MTKLALIPVVLLACLLGACGAPFTSSDLFTGTGQGGEPQAGAAGAAPAIDAGSAGLTSAGSAGASGALAGAGGMAEGGAPDLAGAPGAAGSSPVQKPPCEHAVDTVSPGYLALGSDTCYRTKEVFDTITCSGPGWAERTIKVNGQLAACNQTQAFPAMIEGYNYFDIEGAAPGSDTLRWSLSTGQ